MPIDKLKERFGADLLETHEARGEETIVIAPDRVLDVMKALRDEPGFEFNMLSDLTAVDWPDRKPRFDVIYHLNSLTLHHRLRVKVRTDAPAGWVNSVTSIWKGADWLERECFDMFGVEFHNHGDLRRILLYDSFQGHPLRKDYNYQHRQPIVPETDPVVTPLPPSK